MAPSVLTNKRWLLLPAVVVTVVVVLICHFRGGAGPAPADPARLAAATAPLPGRPGYFVEISSRLGLGDQSEVWPDGNYAFYELMGGGVGLFDYDGDGDMDIIQVCHPPPGRPKAPAPNRLFPQQADGTFRDVTRIAGLGDPGYGQGVAIADIEGDGDPDVYFTNYGPDALYLSNGDGTFTNTTGSAGISGDQWSMGAAFFDYDRDDDPDLYVTHYVLLDTTEPRFDRRGLPEYRGPAHFATTSDTLCRNNGDGTFTDVTDEAGVGMPGYGLGVVCVDLTGDGWVDIYVANDGIANFLWVNQQDGTFVDEAVMRGVAFNDYGVADSTMGVAVGDVDGNGGLDLFTTTMGGQAKANGCLYQAGEKGCSLRHRRTPGFRSPCSHIPVWAVHSSILTMMATGTWRWSTEGSCTDPS